MLLKDTTRPSRVKPLTPEKIKQVVHKTLPPESGFFHRRKGPAPCRED
jgi:hypothetical protein